MGASSLDRALTAWLEPGSILGTRAYHGVILAPYYDHLGAGAPVLRHDDAVDDRGGEQQRQIPERKEEHLASHALARLEIETDGEPEKDTVERQRRTEVDPAEAKRGERDAEQRQTNRVDHDLPPRLSLAAHDRKHRHGGTRVITLLEERQGPEMGRSPGEDNGEEPPGQWGKIAGYRCPADEWWHGASGAADDDVMGGRALEPLRVDEHVEEISGQGKRGRGPVDDDSEHQHRGDG